MMGFGSLGGGTAREEEASGEPKAPTSAADDFAESHDVVEHRAACWPQPKADSSLRSE